MYEQETHGFIVRANPRFQTREPSADGMRFLWSYEITIENRSPETAQLLTRYWRIVDGNGITQEVRGDGVIGEQPVIEPGASYTYESGCPLGTPSGFMVGAYTMRREGGDDLFEIAVPAFALDSPYAGQRAH